MDVNTVWSNIVSTAGEKFYTQRNIEFVYTIHCDKIQPTPINGSKIDSISKETISIVLKDYSPLRTVSQINQKFRAPSYIFAILNDPRIKIE